MAIEINLDDLPIGYALDSARRDETITVSTIGFVSSEDGDKLIKYLEGLPSMILSRLPANHRVNPSQINDLLVIIRRDKTATVYLNELLIINQVVLKRAMKKGEYIFSNDIADSHRIELKGVEIPPDSGVIFLFSVGWRKGLFYDLQPLDTDESQLRSYDLSKLLAEYNTYLMFQERFKLTDDDWTRLFQAQWFPFVALKDQTIQSMMDHARNEWPIDDLLDQIANEVRARIKDTPTLWKHPLLESHVEVLQKVVEHYIADDFLSANLILYPRIEGIMRSYHTYSGVKTKQHKDNLIRTIISAEAEKRHSRSLLLPNRFQEYLDQVYFKNFKPGDDPPMSRHSVAHGVATVDKLSLKEATIGILIVLQLIYFLPSEKDK